MSTYRARIPGPSTAHLNHLSGLLRRRRTEVGSRWRRLTAGEQALLVLAHLRCGDTLAQLAGSFDVGTTTVYRYVGEAIAVLAEQAPGLGTALTSRWRHPVTILDGTLIPSQRVHALPAAPGWYSGKHKRYGVNIQALTCGDGSLLWVSDALPGATHHLTATRHHQIIATAAELNRPGAGGDLFRRLFTRQRSMSIGADA